MSSLSQIPKLRFSEFTYNWEEVVLNDIATFSKGKNISKSDIIDDGKYECIRYGELYTNYNEIIEVIVSKTNLPKENLFFSKANDVIIPSSGETQLDIATASCVLKNNIALGGDLNIIRTKENGVFISFYLNSAKKKKIASLAQGNSVVHLYNHQLQGLKLNLPNFEEQQKIASFLSAIDKKIEQLQQKKSLLEDYKKGVMQEIFSKEIRFKDSNGKDYPDWEKSNLGNIGKVSMCKRIMKDQTSTNSDGVPFYKIGTFGKQPDSYISKSLYEEYKEKYSFPNRGDILISASGTIGRTVIYDGEPAYFQDSNIIWVANDEQMILNDFLFYIYQIVRWNTENTTIARLYNNNVRKIQISIPNIDEQTKIANFLSAVDKKIDIVNTQIENTQQFKKGLLQQMFV